jgi:hypothetical protein
MLDPKALREDGRRRLRGWLRQMTLGTTVAVVGAILITVAFLILGAELLRPRGLVPAEDRIVDTLGTHFYRDRLNALPQSSLSSP